MEEKLIEEERDNELLDSISKLDKMEQEIISLKFGALYTNREIVKIIKLSESNVGTILYRSMKKLRKQGSEELMILGDRKAYDSRDDLYNKFSDRLNNYEEASKTRKNRILKVEVSIIIVVTSVGLIFESGVADGSIDKIIAKFRVEETIVDSNDYLERTKIFLGRVYDEFGEPIDNHRSGEKIYAEAGKVIYYLDEDNDHGREV